MIKLIKPEIKATWMMRFFGLLKIPLIFYCRPKVIRISDTDLEVNIKLTRRTKNHLNSMYFGVLSIGADLTGGFLAMHLIRKSQYNISLIFKDFHADFLKRAESDVHFYCIEGLKIKKLVKLTEKSDERQNALINIFAKVPSISDEIVAKFKLTLSLKKLNE